MITAVPLEPTALRQARRALEHVQTSPTDAERRARAVLRRSSAPEATVLAMWALGRARFEQNAPAEASDTLRDAVRHATAHGLADHAAQIRVSRSLCLITIGASAQALRELTLAERVLTGQGRARAVTQRGLLLARLGRLDEALVELDRAEAESRACRDDLGLTRLLVNRGSLHAMLGQLASADRDLAEALCLANRLEQHLLVARTLHNQAFLEARRGDLPKALRLYGSAAQGYQAIGDLDAVAPSFANDRCELLLAAGLVVEALDVAAKAVDAAATSGDVLALAEARLLLARARLATGDYAASATQANEAATLFKRSNRAPWIALANYVAVQAEVVAVQDRVRPPRRLLDRAVHIAEQLTAEGWAVEAMHVRTFVGRMAIALGQLDVAQQALTAAADARNRGTAELRVSAWHATALLRYAADDHAGAKRALNSGFAVLDEHRALLGATELRAHAASHGAELARLGLRIALEGARPRDVLTWAERTRAAALHLPPVRPPDDDALADLLARWRQATLDAREATLEGDEQAPARFRVQALESQIREKARLAWGAEASSAAGCDVPTLLARLGRRVLVEYLELEGDLRAVVIADGRVSLRRVGAMDEIGNEIDFVRFNHQRLAISAGRGGSQAVAVKRFVDTAALLGDRLVTPLRLPPGRDVVIVPTGVLHAVPWNALPGLQNHVLTVSPSAGLWCRGQAADRPRRDPTTGHSTTEHPTTGDPTTGRRGATGAVRPGATPSGVAVVAGPDLQGGREEAVALADLYGTADLLVGDDATVASVLAACERSQLMHLAAHGDFRADSPMFSSLRMADGQLTVYDLERLRSVPVTMVLPACDAAAADVRAGDELLGTASALLTLGVRSVIAPVAKIPDLATMPLVLALHDGMRRGLSPSRALAEAARDARARGGAADLAAAAALLCIGADDADDADD